MPKSKGLQAAFLDWMKRPARRLEHMRLEGFSEAEVDGFVLRAALQKTAFVLIASGLCGLAIYALGNVERHVGVALWFLYAFFAAIYVGANLFAVMFHLLVVTRRYMELRAHGDSMRDFGEFPLKLAADAVSLVEQAGLAAFVVVLYQRFWPD